MPTMTPEQLKLSRMHMWLDQINRNLAEIADELEEGHYIQIRQKLRDQYRLVRLIRNTFQSKTIFQGWKTSKK